jgi:hypothetical protein
MIDVRSRGEIIVYLEEIMKIVADADNMLDAGLPRFLGNYQLFDGVFIYKTNVCMSIKKTHYTPDIEKICLNVDILKIPWTVCVVNKYLTNVLLSVRLSLNKLPYRKQEEIIGVASESV